MVYTVEQALLELCKEQFHFIILKHQLPVLNGLEITPTLRKITKIPIIVITDEGDQISYLLLKKAGVDLVFAKPFSFTTVCKHLKLLTHTYKMNRTQMLKVHDLSLDSNSRQIHRGKYSYFLRNKEFALLEYMMTNAHLTLSRLQILEHVWDYNNNIFTNTVDVHINALRKKIDKPFPTKLIHTIPCVGYMLSNKAPSENEYY